MEKRLKNDAFMKSCLLSIMHCILLICNWELRGEMVCTNYNKNKFEDAKAVIRSCNLLEQKQKETVNRRTMLQKTSDWATWTTLMLKICWCVVKEERTRLTTKNWTYPCTSVTGISLSHDGDRETLISCHFLHCRLRAWTHSHWPFVLILYQTKSAFH